MKKIPFIVLMNLLSLCSFAQWTWLSPSPQGNDLHALCFVDGSTGYAAGDCGTVLKTVNKGNSWSILQTGIDGYLTSIYFTSNTTGYILSNNSQQESVVYKTTDEGLTWTGIPLGTSVNVNSILFFNASIGYIAGDQGVIMKTTDGGNAWVQLDTGTNDYFHSLFFTDEANGYVCGMNGKIWRTSDAGESWTVLQTNVTQTITSVFFTNINTGYAAGFNTPILKTINGGDSWNPVYTDTVNAISVVFTSETEGIIVCYHGDILKTSDAGLTWELIPNIDSSSVTYSAMHFINPAEGFIAGSDGRIIKTTDGGYSWSGIPSLANDNLQSICFSDINTGFISGEHGKLLKTSDSGVLWDTLSIGATGSLKHITFPDVNTGYLVCGSANHDSSLYKTIDAGDTWIKVSDFDSGEISDIFFTDINSGYIVSGNKILKTSDGGFTWNQTELETYINLIDLFFVDANIGYASGEWNNVSGVIYRTTDAGTTWNRVFYMGNSFFINSVFAFGPDTVFAVDSYSHFLMSYDGGNNWTWSNSLIDAGAFWSTMIYFTDKNTGYYLGEQDSGRNIILKTTDGGITWKESIRTSNLLQDICFTSPDHGFAVGEDGSVLETNNGGSPVQVNEVDFKENGFTLYPNPADDYVVFQSDKPVNGLISVSDICGKIVCRLPVNGKSVTFDTGKLNAGIYIYSFKGNGIYKSGKVLIVR